MFISGQEGLKAFPIFPLFFTLAVVILYKKAIQRRQKDQEIKEQKMEAGEVCILVSLASLFYPSTWVQNNEVNQEVTCERT